MTRPPRLTRFVGALVAAGLLAACTVPSATVVPTPTSGTASPAPTSAATVVLPTVAAAGPTLSVAEIAKRIAPSVVQVLTEAVQFDFFNRPTPVQGVGTGEVLDANGNILTNNHVVEGERSITVTFRDGRSVAAKIIGADPDTDLAVIRVEGPAAPPIALGSSANLEVGEEVVAMGHALGLPGGPTVTAGIISALGRSIDAGNDQVYRHLIQTDAAINPGNSGGPLLNRKGQMIGINSAKIESGEGVGFAIAIDQALPLVQELIAKGKIERGYLGVSTVTITPALAKSRGLGVSTGVGLVSVANDSPAGRAGLRANDILVGAAGKPLRNVADLDDLLLHFRSGSTVRIEVVRAGSTVTVEVAVGSRPG